MSAKYQGSCLCGAVSYQSEAEPRYSFNCHCRDCQRQQVQHMHQLLFHQSELKVSGELKYFETLGSSGRAIKRAFCPTCGSQLLAYLKLRLK